MTITRRQALVGPAAIAAAATIPAIPQAVASAPTDVATMTTEQLLAERRTAAEDVWWVMRRHNDVWNELTRRGLDPHQDEPDYRHWKRV
jgi:hypothetical protein